MNTVSKILEKSNELNIEISPNKGYKGSTEIIKYCNNKGIDFSLNLNGKNITVKFRDALQKETHLDAIKVLAKGGDKKSTFMGRLLGKK